MPSWAAGGGQGGDVAVRKEQLAAVRGVDARDDVEQRRLSRTVGTYEAHDLAAAHLEVHLGQGRQTAETLGDFRPREDAAHFRIHSSTMATGRHQPAEAPVIFTGKQQIVNPCGRPMAFRLAIFSIWQ